MKTKLLTKAGAPAATRETAFYEQCVRILLEARIPFMVGGAVGLKVHCGVARDTKDLDLFLKREDIDKALCACAKAGLKTDLSFPHWLAKILDASAVHFVDLIFNSGNGTTPIDDAWFAHASKMNLWGLEVLVCPVEETIWTKAFVMERERYDGADIAHLLRAQASRLDWNRLLERFDDHDSVLLSHLILFRFIYPDQADTIPQWVMQRLLSRLEASGNHRHSSPICRGTLLSREQYLCDIAEGYRDARLPPVGEMSTTAIWEWTKAIDDPDG